METVSNLLVRCCQKEPKYSSYVFLSLLHCYSKERDTTMKEIILKTVAKLAGHLLCVPPILKLLLSLTKSTDKTMRLNSFRLLGDLFESQPKVFTELEAILKSVIDTGNENDADVVLAKLQLIQRICHISADEYGEELLPLLSSVVNTSDAESSAAISVAVLAIADLCRCEVVEVAVVWRMLWQKLGKSEYIAVRPALCRLLSCAAPCEELDVGQEFLDFAVDQLWRFAIDEDAETASAAFEALAKFPCDVFTAAHMPDWAKSHLKISSTATITSNINNEKLVQSVPGSCYVRLLHRISDGTVQGFEQLLLRLLKTELSTIGRGVYQTKKRLIGGQKDEVIDGLKRVCDRVTDRCFQTNWKSLTTIPQSAVVVLLTYQPALEVDRSGAPVKRSILQNGRKYLEVFAKLLTHVDLSNHSDWRSLLSIRHAWCAFMHRLYAALIESRLADLDAAGSSSGRESAANDRRTVEAWLWARDQIMERVKKAAAESVSARLNAVTCLGAMVIAVQQYVDSMDSTVLQTDSRSSPYIGHSQWSICVAETLLTLATAGVYKSKASTLNLANLTSPSATVSSLCALALVDCLPSVLKDKNTVGFLGAIDHTVRDFLANKCAQLKSPEAHSPLAFGLPLALGIIIGRIGGIVSCQLQTALLANVVALRNVGSVLALAFAYGNEPKTVPKNVLETLSTLVSELPEFDLARDVALMTVAKLISRKLDNVDDTAHTELLNTATSDWVTEWRAIYLTENQNGQVVAAIDDCLLQLDRSDLNSLRKVEIIHSIAALLGFSPVNDTTRNEAFAVRKQAECKDALKALMDVANKQICSSEPNELVIGALCSTLASVHDRLVASKETASQLPDDYDYLSDSSVLRYAFEELSTAVETISSVKLHSLLRCLSHVALPDGDRNRGLPPVNFSPLLLPLWQSYFGGGEQETQLPLLITKMAVLEKDATLLTQLLCAANLNRMQAECLQFLLDYIDVVILKVRHDARTLENLLRHCYERAKERGQLLLYDALFKALCTAFTVDLPVQTKDVISDLVLQWLDDVEIRSYHQGVCAPNAICFGDLCLCVVDESELAIKLDIWLLEQPLKAFWLLCRLTEYERVQLATAKRYLATFLALSTEEHRHSACCLLLDSLTVSVPMRGEGGRRLLLSLLNETKSLLLLPTTAQDDVNDDVGIANGGDETAIVLKPVYCYQLIAIVLRGISHDSDTPRLLPAPLFERRSPISGLLLSDIAVIRKAERLIVDLVILETPQLIEGLLTSENERAWNDILAKIMRWLLNVIDCLDYDHLGSRPHHQNQKVINSLLDAAGVFLKRNRQELIATADNSKQFWEVFTLWNHFS